MPNLYRENILKTTLFLMHVREQLYTHAVNIAMNNALKDLDNTFEKDEIFEFELEYFNNSNDINLQKTYDLIRTIETTVDSFINLNNITKSELKNIQ